MDHRPNPFSPQAPQHEGWHDWLHHQQRYWHEWMEAGQLWLSWWVSTLPPVQWPPAGTVLPPQQPRNGTVPPADPVAALDTAAVPHKAAPARKPRAAAQRHH